jgi:hypothetical protein
VALRKNNITNLTQAGFRAHHSTEDLVEKLNDEITKALNTARHVVGVFIDFEKAYDMVWRMGVLIKLQNLGISGKTFQYYIKNLFTKTSIRVKVGNTLSLQIQTDNGVIQGSVLARSFFS